MLLLFLSQSKVSLAKKHFAQVQASDTLLNGTNLFYFRSFFQTRMILTFLAYGSSKTCVCVSRPVSDVTSDLTIEVGSASFSLHKVKKFELN